MKPSLRLVALAALLGLAGLRTAAQHASLAEFTFAIDAQGWQAIDIPNGSSYSAQPAPSELKWSANTPGFGASVELTDTSDGTVFFSAPAAALGQLPSALGGFLEFELASNVRTWVNDNAVVILGTFNGQPRAVVAPLGVLPSPEWTSYALRIVPGNFRFDTPAGPPVSRKELQEVLSHPLALRIPAEFGAGLVETVHLRNVRLFAPAQLAVDCVPALTLNGEIGKQFRIEYIEALGGTTWKAFTNVTLATSPFVYIDAAALGEPRRFYRAVELAP